MAADNSALAELSAPLYRSLGEIAADIRQDWGAQAPREARACIAAMADLRRIDDESAYRTVSQVRQALNQRRSRAAARVKRELETMLSHYRADWW